MIQQFRNTIDNGKAESKPGRQLCSGIESFEFGENRLAVRLEDAEARVDNRYVDRIGGPAAAD